MKSFPKILRKLLFVIFISIAVFLLFIFMTTLTDYKPEKEIVLTRLPNSPVLNIDTISIVTWNIGYAGLDKDMDFFYDGGAKTRTTKTNTQRNLDSIIALISRNNFCDFIFMQEVDSNSKRSHKIDMVSEIALKMPEHTAIYGINYNVPFVPVPFLSPMGKVESGIMTLSKYVPMQSVRYAYTSESSWPKAMFLLDRCFVMCRYLLQNGKQLVIINTHNSAFDNKGEQRSKEMLFLKEVIEKEYNAGNYVIVGGDWNQIPPHSSAQKYNGIETEYFSPHPIPFTLMPESWNWVTDGNPTNRFLDEPYVKGRTKETLIDFFLVSPNVEVLHTKMQNNNFEYSDHNPVIAKFVISQHE